MSRAPALFTKHRGIALGIAREFYLPGADDDDVRQEALIGLWNAARAYDPKRGPFPPFARLCVRRQLQSAVRYALRLKAGLLTEAERGVDAPTAFDVDELIHDRERLALLIAGLDDLSDLERRALADSLNDVPQTKRTNNAVERAKRKLRKVAA